MTSFESKIRPNMVNTINFGPYFCFRNLNVKKRYHYLLISWCYLDEAVQMSTQILKFCNSWIFELQLNLEFWMACDKVQVFYCEHPQTF